MRSRVYLILAIFVIASACLYSCAKPVDKNVTGPGGLPKGTVKTAEAPGPDESKLPLYPGAKRIYAGSYETTDSLEMVVSYYAKLLSMEPVAVGEVLQSREFVTPEYKLSVVPMVPASSGTEIHFSLPAKKTDK